MTKRTMVVTALITATLLAAPVVFAARHRATLAGAFGFDDLGPVAKLRWLRAELDLSDDQVDQMRKIAREVRRTNEANRDEIKGNMREVARVLLENPSDLDAARSLLERQKLAEQKARENALSGFAKAMTVLTPDQRARAIELLDQMKTGTGSGV